MTHDAPSIGSRAKERFAELLSRHELGERIDWERAIDACGDDAASVRELHRRWATVERLFSGLASAADALDDAERELRAPAPADPSLHEALARLRSPARGAERYLVRERIGQGGMGTVSRAFDRDLDRDVALKTIRVRSNGSSTPDGRALRRFLQEARIAARLEHPAILPVHDIGIDAQGRVYFTMPLVRGTTLATALDRSAGANDAWPLARTLEAFLKICDALAYAHSRGVVHRDLKPANVLLGAYGEVYVTDWGLARIHGEHGAEAELDTSSTSNATDAPAPETAIGAVLGTAPYMAPEQARGDLARIGARTDVYGLGAILYHVLAGRAPYSGVPENDLIERVRAGAPASLGTIAPAAPQELVSICERAMARRVEDRYADCSALATDLRAYTNGRVVRAHESGAWPEAKKWLVRNRRVAGISCASASFALALLVATWNSERSARHELLRLSDVQRLNALEARSRQLWPATPDRVEAMSQWIDDAERLLRDLPTHERTLARLRDDAIGGSAGPPYAFESAEDQWRHDTLASLVERLQRLASQDRSRSAVADVRARRELAASLEQVTLVAAAADWERARRAIAASPIYAGLDLAPQLGLVPLGPDPRTGLWEFAHVASGTAARRGSDGRLQLDAGSSIVLVLVPAGRFTMGSTLPQRTPRDDARSADESDTRADPDLLARDDEAPPVELALDAFFLSKHELTQAQWERSTGEISGHHRDASGLLPVETIDWQQAKDALARLALELPTEAQWECAARGGTATRFWFGRATADLVGRVNAGWTADGKPLHAGEAPATVRVDDGSGEHPWGLMHMLGNVAEWVADGYAPNLAVERRGGDGFAPQVGATLRSVRGGAFDSAPRDLRCAARRSLAPSTRGADVGVRAARRIGRGRSP